MTIVVRRTLFVQLIVTRWHVNLLLSVLLLQISKMFPQRFGVDRTFAHFQIARRIVVHIIDAHLVSNAIAAQNAFVACLAVVRTTGDQHIARQHLYRSFQYAYFLKVGRIVHVLIERRQLLITAHVPSDDRNTCFAILITASKAKPNQTKQKKTNWLMHNVN